MMKCELCAFNTPKGTATAVFIRNGALLLTKRNQAPYKGMWDLPGGYMNQGETPEETLRREMKEELGIDISCDFIGWFPGTASWNRKTYAVLSHAYLVDYRGDITLNKKENSHFAWMPLKKIKPSAIAFVSDQAIVRLVKKKFASDYPALVSLIAQLDSSATVDEMNLYRSLLNGYMSKKIIDGKLVGAGWIFPRRTFLRKQAVVEDMIVDESQRGKGLGKEILLDLLRWAKKQGVEVVELTTNPRRLAANALYQKIGFQLHPTNHYLYQVK
jgi:ADP-ribose pyrophosphatase YjhB (NUDIX family)/N-acetylglutamate synthase-like GNAT family acetyltransferase